jgi:PQQ-like domain
VSRAPQWLSLRCPRGPLRRPSLGSAAQALLWVCLIAGLAGLAGPASLPADAAGPQPEAPWAQYKRDPQKTARSPFNGPSAPELLWKFSAGNPILSGPVIAADGTIYFGTENSRLYAVSPCGK